MEEFKIDRSLGDYIIVEPLEKSGILVAEDNLFKVVSIGKAVKKDVLDELKVGDIILVRPGSVQKGMGRGKYFEFIQDIDAVTTVMKC